MHTDTDIHTHNNSVSSHLEQKTETAHTSDDTTKYH